MKICPECKREYADHVKFCTRDGEALAAIEAQRDPLLGRVIGGRYEVLEFLGGGGFGNVYKVRNVSLDEEEALKIIHPELLRDREPMDRFRREAKLLRKLGSKSAHIVDMYNMEEDKDDGFFYFTMELVEGDALTQIVMKEGSLAVDRVVDLMRQVCKALKVAHSQGIIHRDLKLDNILIAHTMQEERVKILDFGIAKVKGQKSLSDLTKGMPGTVGYAAPEQVKGEADKIGATTDLFAAGVILYNLLTGCDPWNGDKVGKPLSEGGDWEVIRKTLEENPVPPRKLNPEVPKDLDGITLKLLHKDQKRRFQTATDLDEALAKVEESLERAAQAKSSPRLNVMGVAGSTAVKVKDVAGSTAVKVKDVAGGSAALVKSAAGPVAAFVKKAAMPVAGVAALAAVGLIVKAMWPEPVVPASIEVSPVEASVFVDSTLQLTAILKDSAGQTISGDVEWSTSDAGIVNVDPRTGEVTGVAVGYAFVRATSEGHVTSSTVSVRQLEVPPQLAAVSVEPGEANIPVGSATQLLATLVDDQGNSIDQPVRWSSSDPGIVEVDPSSGEVTAVAEGSAVITASSGDQQGQATVTVSRPTAAQVTRLSVNRRQASMDVGASIQLRATPRDAQDNALDRPVSWSSSNANVAAVNRSGTVTANAPGSARITAQSDGIRATISVTVEPAAVAELQVDRPDVSLTEGEAVELKAIPRDARGNELADRPIDWRSDNEGVARVDRTGDATARVEGVAPGTAKIVAAAGDKVAETMVSVKGEERLPVRLGVAGSGGYDDGKIVLSVNVSQQGLDGSDLCAVAVFLDEEGQNMEADGEPVTTAASFPVRSAAVPVQLVLPAEDLGLKGMRAMGEHRLSAEVRIFRDVCERADTNNPLAVSDQIPFCIRGLAFGFQVCD